MTPERAVPAVCLDLVKHFECGDGPPLLTAQLDPCGIMQIGYGHKVGPDDPLLHARITPDTATALALEDLDTAAAELEATLPPVVRKALLENEYAALIDFVYNEGVGRFRGSTLHTLVAAGNFNSAAAQFSRWVYGQDPHTGEEVQRPGLVARRKAELMLWNTGRWR